MHNEADNRATDQTGARQTDAHSSPVLSVVVPVRNDAPSVQVMVPILRAVIEVPNEVLVVYDDPDDACVPVIERLRERFPTLRGIRNDVARGLLPACRSASPRHADSMSSSTRPTRLAPCSPLAAYCG
jgi:hypothetical protein